MIYIDAEQLQDGLYNIKDGKIYKYKAKGGTVRTYKLENRPQGEWIDAEIPLESGGSMPIQACNLCKTFYPLAYTGGGHRFCPNCGARMKGADDEV